MKRGALIAAAAAWILATSLDAQAQEPILLGMSSPQTGGAAYLASAIPLRNAASRRGAQDDDAKHDPSPGELTYEPT